MGQCVAPIKDGVWGGAQSGKEWDVTRVLRQGNLILFLTSPGARGT